ncbi:hypothetical protein JCM17960_12420 [Magnetospira thiophila]
MQFRVLKTVAVVVAVLGFGVGAAQAAETSACKGLSNADCAAKESCTWVESYTTQKGNKVSAHCRAKGSKGQGMSKGLSGDDKKEKKNKAEKDKN